MSSRPAIREGKEDGFRFHRSFLVSVQYREAKHGRHSWGKKSLKKVSPVVLRCQAPPAERKAVKWKNPVLQKRSDLRHEPRSTTSRKFLQLPKVQFPFQWKGTIIPTLQACHEAFVEWFLQRSLGNGSHSISRQCC